MGLALHERDLHSALHLLGEVGEATDGVNGYARAGVEALSRLVASEITTLSICDLASGRREVTGTPPGALSAQDRACFDRHFRSHPLVRYHADLRGQGTHRISDSVPFSRFREGALYCEYYRRIGIDHAVAVPLLVNERTLVSFVLNRRGSDFGERDCALLELVRAHLARLYRQAHELERARAALARLEAGGEEATLSIGERLGLASPQCFAALPLTPREREVLSWVAAGKTDRDIAGLLGISVRTVQKHLEHCYIALGVETRTAAVMRALGTLH
jgi:DNA-binding CsgD family transcriptional regulator/GAF domain-containing protein